MASLAIEAEVRCNRPESGANTSDGHHQMALQKRRAEQIVLATAASRWHTGHLP
ncbi:hypothetical protein ACQP1G_38505 [Nocardia sp. CA-107356]|uniref:hypothetical protein n=1 Tax=Nocardia sp. CA-107356 TaxID=3239972 RepID=UPI003D8A611F